MCRASTRQYKNTNICPLHCIKIRFETSLCNGVFKCCPILVCTPILPIFINLRPLESRFPGRVSKVIDLMSLFAKKTNYLWLILISPTTCYINLCHISCSFLYCFKQNGGGFLHSIFLYKDWNTSCHNDRLIQIATVCYLFFYYFLILHKYFLHGQRSLCSQFIHPSLQSFAQHVNK